MTRRGKHDRDRIKGGHAVRSASQLIVGMKSGCGSDGNAIGN